MKKVIVLIGLVVCTNTFSAYAQDGIWQDVKETSHQQTKERHAHSKGEKILKRRSLNLDETTLKQYLYTQKSARSTSSLNSESSQLELDLPLPNGSLVRVHTIESPILSAELAAIHPEIKTWRVVGVDDPAISGRIDFTTKGFHGMLVLADGETIFIDPDREDSNVYHSLSKRDNPSHFNQDYHCEVHGQHSLLSEPDLSRTRAKQSLTKDLSGKKLAQLPADNLITYRLALAGTAEYTAAVGGSTSNAYASMVTTVNRVNQIYQRDLGVKLQLVTGQQTVYTNAATDPYTDSSSTALVNENMASLHDVVGASNYDIGHVFARGSQGGLAYLGVACLNGANISSGSGVVFTTGIKAGGATGLSTPQGEIFNIQLVAHELGHQLGASHTFNGVLGGCGGNNREGDSAVEPGGGSTIMSYTGLCGSDSFQSNADAMFHWKSIEQISEYTRVDISGSSCGARASTGNQKPVADAGTNHVIPINTPFLLEGTATGGTSYTWDQMDAGTASNVDVDMGDNAIIRTLLPSSNKDRYIPRLSNLFAGTSTKGEKLPVTVRNINFAFVVRDSSGGIASDSKLISTEDTGVAFRVLSQSTSQTYSRGQAVDIAWQVADTDNAPISCSSVDVKLLRSNGTENILQATTANDGVETVIIPISTPLMSGARIMVACVNQPFFQISSGNITIQDGVADTIAPVISVTGSSAISIAQGTSYTDAGATAVDNIDGIVSVSTSGTVNTAVANTYTITYSATDSSSNTATATRAVTVTPAVDTVPPVIILTGAGVVSIEQGETYTELGATATDNIDSMVTVAISGSVNTAILDSYTITYTATDLAGNKSTKTRTVNVVEKMLPDSTAPVISLNGSTVVSVLKGTNYAELGATALDDRDGIVGVIVSGTVDISTVGFYTITYTATDLAGNISTLTRKVDVTKAPDNTAPIITLTGDSTITLEVGNDYDEPGYGAFDDRDGIVSVDVTGTVDTDTVGTYVLTYTATDAAGNKSTKTRTVNVVEKMLPDTIDDQENENDGEKDEPKPSAGGSIGYFLFSIILLGLRKRFLIT
ncbi:MAG: immunoglobulin-like domain-containing protein [Thiotrichaceae bacterium]